MKFLIVIYVRTACQNYWTIIAIGRVLGCSAAKRSKITAQLWASSGRAAAAPPPLHALANEQDHCIVRAPELEATRSKYVPASASRSCPHLEMSNITA